MRSTRNDHRHHYRTRHHRPSAGPGGELIRAVEFYLGTDVGGLRWGVPVMVSYGRLRDRVTLPTATAPVAIDSRGYSELSQHGRWTITARSYAADLLRYRDGFGHHLVWASPQDWMCTPPILAKTGKTVAEHQQLTGESVLLLRALLAGRVHVIPVLQGRWDHPEDYLAHVAWYGAHGIHLRTEPVVGLGSVARVQHRPEVAHLASILSTMGIALHGFGVKTKAMDSYAMLLASADSFSWAKHARHRGGRCPHGLVKWETNCPRYALAWRERILTRLSRGQMQLALDVV